MTNVDDQLSVGLNILTSVIMPDFTPLQTLEAISFIDDLYDAVYESLPDPYRRYFATVTSGEVLRTGVLRDQSSRSLRNNPMLPLYLRFSDILRILLSQHGISIYAAPLWRRYLNIIYAAACGFIDGSVDAVCDAVRRCHQTVPFVYSNVFSDCNLILEIDEEMINYVSQKQALLTQLKTCAASEKIALWQQIFQLESYFCLVKQDSFAYKFIVSRQLFNYECALADCYFDYFITADVAVRIHNFYFTPAIDIASAVCRCDIYSILGMQTSDVVKETSKKELAVGVVQRGIYLLKQKDLPHEMLYIAYCEILLNSLRSDLAEVVIAKMLQEEVAKDVVDSPLVLYLIKYFLQKKRIEIAKQIISTVEDKVDSLFYTNLAQCCSICGGNVLESIFSDIIDGILQKYYWDQQLLAVLYYGLADNYMRYNIFSTAVNFSNNKQAYLRYIFGLYCSFRMNAEFTTPFLGDFVSFVRFPTFTNEILAIDRYSKYQIIFDRNAGFFLKTLTPILPFENFDETAKIRVIAPNNYESALIASFKHTNDFFAAFKFTGYSNFVVDEVQQKQMRTDKFIALKYPPTTPIAVYNVLERTRKIWSEDSERSSWKQATMPWDMVLDIIFAYNPICLISPQAMRPIGLKY